MNRALFVVENLTKNFGAITALEHCIVVQNGTGVMIGVQM